MLKNKYLTIRDFDIVDVAVHCDFKKLDIAISDALSFELPEILCEYYGIAKKALDNADDETYQELLNGGDYECGGVTRRFLGIKALLVYYSYSNYLMQSVLNDTGLGFKQKTDNYSIPTPLKDIKDISNSYRNRGFSVFNQMKDFLCHNSDLTKGFNIPYSCGCDCSTGDCYFTEKRVSAFKPRIIKKRL